MLFSYFVHDNILLTGPFLKRFVKCSSGKNNVIVGHAIKYELPTFQNQFPKDVWICSLQKQWEFLHQAYHLKRITTNDSMSYYVECQWLQNWVDYLGQAGENCGHGQWTMVKVQQQQMVKVTAQVVVRVKKKKNRLTLRLWRDTNSGLLQESWMGSVPSHHLDLHALTFRFTT